MLAYADYLFVITLPESLISEITRYKRASVNTIGHFEGMHSRANILVTRQNRCKPFFAQPAILQMEERINTMPPVQLVINGFGFVSNDPANITIYAGIKRATQTQLWFKLLFKQMKIKAKDFVPYIPVVQNIPPRDFKKLWPHFEHRVFNECFTVNSITVLHRETFVEYCEWRVYKELFFANRLSAF